MEQIQESVELVTTPAQNTQFYLFNLFADYIVPHGGKIWTNDLLYLLDLLGVSERAARTTLSRMKQQDWFVTHKNGRRTQYELTAQGRTILAEGEKRIFEPPFRQWDGQWHLVVYSLPEEKRKLRNAFRKKLLWFGYGRLAPGSWISAHDYQAELESVCAHLGIEAYVTLFTAVTADDGEIVEKCWQLPELAADYQRFVDRYQSAYEAAREGQVSFSQSESFIRRFWLTYRFQRFPLKDPNLPQALLPAEWIGHTARQLFMDYRALLTRQMGDFVAQVMAVQG